MATVSYFLDKRVAKENYPLKMRIVHGKNKSALIGMDIKLTEEQWDGKGIINHKNAEKLNDYLIARRNHAEGIITSLKVAGILDNYSASDLKKVIENNGVMPLKDDDKKNKFYHYYLEQMELKEKESTKSSYSRSSACKSSTPSSTLAHSRI